TFEKLLEHSAVFNNFTNAEVREIDFSPLPHNENYELDLHKPYIDEIELSGLTRVKEVMDVWLDSGAMPFAQDPQHVAYPADYIAEAIDQTRGWFYTLHAVGILMGKGKAYKNVISLGHILDASGQKMSKSKGNVVDPHIMLAKYGADALRLWMYSVNQPGDSKNFDEKTVDELVKKVFNLLSNIVSFYEMHATEVKPRGETSRNVLDVWIISRLNELISSGTKHLDGYKIFEASRPIRDFANDFSTWYIRRSRDRFRENDEDALSTTKFVLLQLAKYMAPFTPFMAEEIYQKFKSEKDPQSVHLCDWPEAGRIDSQILEDMEKVRSLASKALELRQNAGMKVRQPLLKLTIPENLPKEFLEIIADEVNVKKIEVGNEIALDTTLTPELIEEGKVREAIRAVQDWRKEQNLRPGEKAAYKIPESDREVFEKYAEEIRAATHVDF